MDLGDFLLQYKTKNNLSYRKFAMLIGINENSLLRIINKKVKPSGKTGMKVSRLTGISFSEVIDMRESNT